MAVVEVRQLTKRYEGSQQNAVDGMDIATADNEFLVLLGPSGCGKTTLLRMIAGLEQPTSGEIWIGGRSVAGLPPRARQIAMVFQSYALYPHKTIGDNIQFPLKAEGMGKGERAEKAKWAADLLGIGHLLARRPRALSGGERQRVALARALVRDPSVFLLDEPLSNLDAKLRAAARDDLKEFQARVGTTTIYVTHDQVEAMGMGDRIAVLSEGRLRQLGQPRDIYDHPADTFVATFVGSPPMNVLPQGDTLLGFRPECFLPESVSEAGDGGLTLTFHVQRVEHLGSERHLVGTAEGLGPEAAGVKVRSVIPVNIGVPVEPGQPHRFVVKPADLRWFDPESGRSTERRRVGVAP
ncbi:MAG: ABC transporter ATP-binding protein [Acidimicrobiales bacterium]